MDLVLQLVVPHADAETAARLRAVSKRAKNLVDADAHHADRIRRERESHAFRLMIRVYQQNRLYADMYWAFAPDPPAPTPPPEKKTGFWRRLSKLISRAN